MKNAELRAINEQSDKEFTTLFRSAEGRNVLADLERYAGNRFMRKTKEGAIDQAAMIYAGGQIDFLTYIKDRIHD